MKLTTVQVAETLKISRPQALNLFKHGLLPNSGKPGRHAKGKRGVFRVEASVLREFTKSEAWRQRKPGKALFDKMGRFRTYASNGTNPGATAAAEVSTIVKVKRHAVPAVPVMPSEVPPMGGLRDQLDRIERKVDRLLKELGVS